MMADTATSGHYAAMKTFLNSTTEQVAAVLARFRSAMRANLSRPEGFECRPRQQTLSPADFSRIPAVLRRRRLPLRLHTRLDASKPSIPGRRA